MIKRTPTDFQVEETLSNDLPSLAQKEGLFALYRLSKESLATPEAVGRAARELKVPANSFAYAGLKDKHASTIQHVTLKLENFPAPPEKASGGGWSLERMAFVPRPIASADIAKNRFRITLRNLTPQDCFDMDRAVRLLATSDSGNAIRVVNYFGDQRFGSARHGQGFIAAHLIKGEFEAALKLAIATEARKDRMEQKVFKRTLLENWGRWSDLIKKLRPCPERKAIERLANSGGDFRAAFCALPYMLQQLSVYAFQSHLWNSTARKLVEQRCVPLGPVLAADDVFGEMLFPTRDAILPELTELDLPLLARKTELREPWKDAAEAVLHEEGIAVTQLEIPGVRRPFFGEEPRKLFFVAEEFQPGRPEKDESADDPRRKKRTVSFSLPRGCYATVLLRALGQ
jgi:tRNA pseudouridine13 synthase